MSFLKLKNLSPRFLWLSYQPSWDLKSLKDQSTFCETSFLLFTMLDWNAKKLLSRVKFLSCWPLFLSLLTHRKSIFFLLILLFINRAYTDREKIFLHLRLTIPKSRAFLLVTLATVPNWRHFWCKRKISSIYRYSHDLICLLLIKTKALDRSLVSKSIVNVNNFSFEEPWKPQEMLEEVWSSVFHIRRKPFSKDQWCVC